MENSATDKEMLLEKAETLIKTHVDYIRLKATEKTADVLSTLTAKIVILMSVALFMLFVNIGICLYIGEKIGNYYWGFLIVSGFYFLVSVLFIVFKNTFLKSPIQTAILSQLTDEEELEEIITQQA